MKSGCGTHETIRYNLRHFLFSILHFLFPQDYTHVHTYTHTPLLSKKVEGASSCDQGAQLTETSECLEVVRVQ